MERGQPTEEALMNHNGLYVNLVRWASRNRAIMEART
jgi:hypothetical protein